MTEEEFDKYMKEALELCLKEENQSWEMELELLNKEPVKFSKEHERKMKKIFKQARKMAKEQQKSCRI